MVAAAGDQSLYPDRRHVGPLYWLHFVVPLLLGLAPVARLFGSVVDEDDRLEVGGEGRAVREKGRGVSRGDIPASTALVGRKRRGDYLSLGEV